MRKLLLIAFVAIASCSKKPNEVVLVNGIESTNCYECLLSNVYKIKYIKWTKMKEFSLRDTFSAPFTDTQYKYSQLVNTYCDVTTGFIDTIEQGSTSFKAILDSNANGDVYYQEYDNKYECKMILK